MALTVDLAGLRAVVLAFDPDARSNPSLAAFVRVRGVPSISRVDPSAVPH